MPMYAIVEVGGKQYRVEKGDRLLVDRMHERRGRQGHPRSAAVRATARTRSSRRRTLGKVKVEAVVTGHERGKKIHVLKYKPKRGYKRRTGHRSDLTRLEIKDIKLLQRASPAVKEAKEAEETPTAEAAAEKPKPKAKASTAKPKAAADKPKPKPKPRAKKEAEDGS